jgi:hypothetical protein
MEGSCDCIEEAVVDSRLWVVLQLGVWAGLTTPTIKLIVCYEILHTVTPPALQECRS